MAGVNPQPNLDGTFVIEDGVIESRVRRPYDLIRMVAYVAIAVGIAVVAYVATGTTTGLETDLQVASALLPPILVLIANVISGVGVILLPLVTGVDLFVRRRGEQLAQALVALLFGVAGASLSGLAAESAADARLLLALAGSTDPARGDVDNPIITGLVAFITVARLVGRPRWGVTSILVVSTTTLVTFLSGGITIAGLAMSIFLGGSIGFATRFLFGISSTRPKGVEIASALEKLGLPLNVLRAKKDTGRGRRYAASTVSGQRLELVVFDRDLEGAGLPGALWRRIRLRDEVGTGTHTVRETLERSALTTYAAAAAGVPMPRLMAVTDVGAESAALVYEHVPGQRFSDLGEVTDDDLDGAWHTLRMLHQARIAHRQPTPNALLRGDDGVVRILDRGRGNIAARDVQIRLDIAEMLCSLAVISSPERVVASARRVIGDNALTSALAAMQPFAFSNDTQRNLRGKKNVIRRIRQLVADLAPHADVEPVPIERLSLRTVVTLVLGAIAGYVLLTQLTNVNLNQLVSADLGWALIALGLSAVTYLAAGMTIVGFVPEQLSYWRTIQAQLAASFTVLVTPSTVGLVATNMRFLTKAGVSAAGSAASLGLSQVVGFIVHIGMLIAAGLAAGTTQDLTFNPPRQAIIAILAIFIAALFVLPLPPVRKALAGRIRPFARQVLPRLVRVGQEPRHLVTGVGGYLILQLAYGFCLIASVHAFGGSVSIASGFFVYLAGSALGQVVPTPGGLGGVEAVLAAGLTAAGLDAGTAISSVLLYRIVTFWIPTVPGWFSFRSLQRKDAL